MHISKFLPAVAAFFALSTCLLAQPNAQWHVVKTLPIGGPGGMDYLSVDAATHQLYVPRTTHTMVIDSASGKTIADIPGQKNAHGVALVPSASRGFISDGGGKGGIVVFDLKTNAVLGTLAAMPDADGIIYDPATNLVLVVSGDGGALMAFKPDVDPKSGNVGEPIALGGAPEFLATDGAGKAFINLEDKNQVAVVDLKARKVLAHWPVAPGGSPVGMSIDAKGHKLFIGCRKPQKLIVMSTETGKVLADQPIGAGVDATVFDKGQGLASCRDGSLTVITETSPGKFETVQTLKTHSGAKTMGLDASTHTLYMPAVDFDAPKPGSDHGATKPGSFQIVVVSR
jgi:DNA-binding beta-propeller fold protein YncE